MAKFLTTTAISDKLQKLIQSSKQELIFVSPFLQIGKRIKTDIEILGLPKNKICIIYKDPKTNPEELSWIKDQGIEKRICEDLHAKCYLNENEAIITSMNFYEYSQINNHEMGIHFTKREDPDLYNDTIIEVRRLMKISKPVLNTIKEVTNTKLADKQISVLKLHGHCIRTGVVIPFNVERPMSGEAFKKWNQYADEEYAEKYCHFSGEHSHGETSFSRPILKKNWSKAKATFGL